MGSKVRRFDSCGRAMLQTKRRKHAKANPQDQANNSSGHGRGCWQDGNVPVTYADAIDSAASLREPGETNEEYERGQRETLARLFPIMEMDTGTRAEEIERDIAAMVGHSTR